MKKSNIILLFSLFLFIASLPFTAVFAQSHEMSGLACFLLGWAEMQGGGIAWMANPLMFFAAFFFLLKKNKNISSDQLYCCMSHILLFISG